MLVRAPVPSATSPLHTSAATAVPRHGAPRLTARHRHWQEPPWSKQPPPGELCPMHLGRVLA